jgi:hypothetical protein
MAQYIDKDALVVEIKWLIELFTIPQYSCEYNNAKADAFKEFLSFIDTLEVKEVDLEKEWKKFLKDGDVGFKKIAKHFFELGLKVQKVE